MLKIDKALVKFTVFWLLCFKWKEKIVKWLKRWLERLEMRDFTVNYILKKIKWLEFQMVFFLQCFKPHAKHRCLQSFKLSWFTNYSLTSCISYTLKLHSHTHSHSLALSHIHTHHIRKQVTRRKIREMLDIKWQ